MKNREKISDQGSQESQYQSFLQELKSQILERENLKSATKNQVPHVVSSILCWMFFRCNKSLRMDNSLSIKDVVVKHVELML